MDEIKTVVEKKKQVEPVDLIDKKATKALIIFWVAIVFIAAVLFLIVIAGK